MAGELWPRRAAREMRFMSPSVSIRTAWVWRRSCTRGLLSSAAWPGLHIAGHWAACTAFATCAVAVGRSCWEYPGALIGLELGSQSVGWWWCAYAAGFTTTNAHQGHCRVISVRLHVIPAQRHCFPIAAALLDEDAEESTCLRSSCAQMAANSRGVRITGASASLTDNLLNVLAGVPRDVATLIARPPGQAHKIQDVRDGPVARALPVEVRLSSRAVMKCLQVPIGCDVAHRGQAQGSFLMM